MRAMRSRNVKILHPIPVSHHLLPIARLLLHLAPELSHPVECPFLTPRNLAAHLLRAVLFRLLHHLQSFRSDKFLLPVVLLQHLLGLFRQVRDYLLHLLLRVFPSSNEWPIS
jgi:hypothetical protein